MDTFPFYIFLAVHLASLIVGMGAVVVIDVFGFLWLFKKIKTTFIIRVAHITQRLIWIGWAGLVLSGIGLIILKGYIDNLTMIKLYFVALIGANGIFLHTIKKALENLSDRTAMPSWLMFRIGFATILSQIGWWSAIAIGFLHRHWRHTIDWPDAPGMYMLGMTFVILCISLAGTLLFPRKR
ncbi:MAG: hypothetical protein A3J54_01955 [Candidatus Ryanbacteria bacterium RIFCSPHIGHO2_02_FULL_45_13b]|uniref:Copper resistance protein D domain-containing protein n=1 Tax=Candidatus Ryanbacteria bacterium RIFCSPHIGHO2_02_FULL_45_13b TaxID=1802117 RepID=A0A1G2G9L9_9BACT|nr:MAG: hypothetical protein A3J54_01955 [Candidatus Ryanbacteria bacterium RIFCSPHIGHO2_02_FULL_45_13b]